jgi:CYTH domain-containing protein
MTTQVPGNASGGAIVPGHRDKYALVERERRFLLAAPPSGVRLTGERQITDCYLTGTRLRLRRVTRARSEPELKLTQKVPATRPGPVSGLITNFYLSQAEYDLLATLPAAELAKTRLSFPPYVIDVFGPPRHGLVLAEVEMPTDAGLAACPPPPGSVAEVTSDERFTGGRLAVTRRPELLAWLAEFGLTVQDDQRASDPARAALPQ